MEEGDGRSQKKSPTAEGNNVDVDCISVSISAVILYFRTALLPPGTRWEIHAISASAC